jgi:hypothetical protein
MLGGLLATCTQIKKGGVLHVDTFTHNLFAHTFAHNTLLARVALPTRIRADGQTCALTHGGGGGGGGGGVGADITQLV